ncbi:C-C chemokine receptor type 1-like [Bos taurus]|uniref:Chemokine C-C motif receptor-like 2 n=1 Tax=Bos taurus TaxID=9913 RepID=Q0V8J0_BOVIN|nr:C-C chemokine receptor type 1-like [Bos taurus]ABG67067.1 chemokine (C-C motif) receptor 1 [Bos taurus]
METSTTAKDYDMTTEYDYGDTTPCQKAQERAFGAQLLPLLYSVVFVIGLVGNILVVLVLYKRIKNIINICLLNLAISDLIFLFTLPFWIDYKVKDDWIFGDAMCKLLFGFFFLGLYSKIFFIILLTIDRYLTNVHPQFKRQCWNITSGTVTSIVVWVLAILASVPGLYFSKTQWWLTHYTCSLHFPPESHGRKWKQFLALKLNILGLILPLLVMTVCYGHIKIIKIMLRTWNKKANIIRLIFVIMITFFLFWTPCNLTVFVSAFQDSLCEHCSQLDLAIEVTEAIAYAHCCMNPIVYVLFCRRYRRVLWYLLYQLTKCRCFLYEEAGEGQLHVHYTGKEERCSVHRLRPLRSIRDKETISC